MRRFLIRSTFILGLCVLSLYGRAWFVNWQFHNLLAQQDTTLINESLSIAFNGSTTLRFKEIRMRQTRLQDVQVTQPFWAWHSAHIAIKKLEIAVPDTTITAQGVQGECHWQSNQLILHYHFSEGNVRTLKDIVVPLHSEGVIHLLPHHTIVFEQVKLTSNDTNLQAEGQIDWRTKDGLLTLTVNDYERVLALLITLNIITDKQAKWGRFGNKIAKFLSGPPADEPQTSITLTLSQGVVRWGPVTLGRI
jgi:hypothetical protein